MPDPVNPLGRFDLGFQEQIDFFRSKLSLGTQTWTDIWEAAHDRSFVVAGAMKADLLDEIRQSVDKAIATGTTLETFRKEFRDTTDRLGWPGDAGKGTTGGFNWRTKVIYETNLRTSYAAGREAQLADPGLQKLLPFRRYVHNDSVLHPRPQHLAWNGLTLPHDHPFWATHSPPNGWGCRCRVTAVAAPRKGDATKPPAGWDDMDADTGAPPGIDKGWGYAPGASVRDELRDLVKGKVAKLPEALGKALAAEIKAVVAPVSEARTIAEAEKIARGILADQNVAYQTEQTGEPCVRFRQIGAVLPDVVRKRFFGRASLKGLDVETANAVNGWLVKSQQVADSIGIPRLRGVHTAPRKNANGSMGDGVLAISGNSRIGGFNFETASTYQLKDGHSGRPENARAFFATNQEKIEKTLWHEFAHHIHQQYGVVGSASYRHPPLEARLQTLLFEQAKLSTAIEFPCQLAMQNSKEYFAECYALRKLGRPDLVPEFMQDFIAKIEKGEMK